jgi:hypothetical protein
LGNDARRLISKPRSSKHNLLPDGEWNSISGWPLSAIGRFANRADRPAFLMFVSQARALWRQALFLSFAIRAMEEPIEFLRRLGIESEHHQENSFATLCDLLHLFSPAEIVSAASGVEAPGIVGTLRRLGDTPVRPETYRTLVAWHAEDDPDPRTWLLQRMVSLDQDRLDALAILDPVFWVGAALPFITSPKAAEDLNNALELVRQHCSTATTEALRKSATALSGEKTIDRWVADWLRQADNFVIPFPEDNVLKPASSAKEVIEMGRRFGNCLGSHCLAAVISGKLSVIEYLPDPAVVILARLDHDNWLLAGTHVAKNRQVPEYLRLAIRDVVQAKCPSVRVVAEPGVAERQVLGRYLPWFDPSDMQFEPFPL